MKKVLSLLLAGILVFSCTVTAFAKTVSATEANEALSQAHTEFNEIITNRLDVDNDGNIVAGDARSVLLYSAGLEEEYAEAASFDVDGDGAVTAIDARCILRVAAMLDSVDLYYTTQEKLDYFNAILNAAKPNNYTLYKNGINYVSNVTVDDPNNVIGSLSDALKKVDSSSDFSSELVNSKGEKTYSGNTYIAQTSRAKNKMMLINNPDTGENEDQSSYLTLSDVSKAEYKTNQTYTFYRYGTKKNSNNTTVLDTSNLVYSETVTGLDSLTVYLVKDNTVDGIHTSKAFTVYEKETLEAEVNEVAESFNSMSMDLSLLGDMQFNVTPSLGSVKYYNAQITVYYYPENGKIVAAYYSNYTDYTMGLYMDIDISIPLYILYLDKAGQVNITNSNQSIYEYYFIGNNPDHIAWTS